MYTYIGPFSTTWGPFHLRVLQGWARDVKARDRDETETLASITSRDETETRR